MFHLSAVAASSGIAAVGSHRLAPTAQGAVVHLRELLATYREPTFKVRLFAPGAVSAAEWAVIQDALGDDAMEPVQA